MSAIATSAALGISPIPWKGPISTIRVGYIKTNGEGTLIVNPTEDDEKFSVLDLIVSSLKDRVVMIEAKGEEVSEKVALEAIQMAKNENKKIIEFIVKMAKKVGNQKEIVEGQSTDDKIMKVLKKDYAKHINDMILKKAEKEFEDEEALEVVVNEVLEKYKSEFERKEIIKAIDYLSKQKIKEMILKTKKRIDGRGPDEIRELSSEVSIVAALVLSQLFVLVIEGCSARRSVSTDSARAIAPSSPYLA